MPSFSELELKVLRWAEARKIIPNSSSQVQALKLVSEVGELCDALIKKDRDGVIDGLGDSLVVLIILADIEGLNLLSCLESAYNEIKDRRGTLQPNGVFIKETITKEADVRVSLDDATPTQWDQVR
jgi:NTP pyrophosphatase (non-canonical NTP hydrolase)